MAGPEQQQRNIKAFEELARDYPMSVGTLNGKRAIAFRRSNGDDAIVYSTGTYMKNEGGYQSPPITSTSVRNSFIDLIQADFVPTGFNEVSFVTKKMRNTNKGRSPGRPRGRPVVGSSGQPGPKQYPQTSMMSKFYGKIGTTPVQFNNVMKEYTESFASLEKSFDEIENRGFNIREKKVKGKR